MQPHAESNFLSVSGSSKWWYRNGPPSNGSGLISCSGCLPLYDILEACCIIGNQVRLNPSSTESSLVENPIGRTCKPKSWRDRDGSGLARSAYHETMADIRIAVGYWWVDAVSASIGTCMMIKNVLR